MNSEQDMLKLKTYYFSQLNTMSHTLGESVSASGQNQFMFTRAYG